MKRSYSKKAKIIGLILLGILCISTIYL